MNQAARLNEGKPQLDFVLDFPRAMEAISRVMELGAAKYERNNWKLGGKPDEEYYAAAMRHLFAAKSGEAYAEDSGCLHIAHAAWNLLALIELNTGGSVHSQMFKDAMAKWQENRHDY